MKHIVWLASYPKSGNTWLRTFLANLLHEKEDPADINRLGGGPIFSARAVFDNSVGIQASDLLPDEIDQLRPAVYTELSAHATDTIFMKAHDAYTYLEDGQPLFPTGATKGAIYLLRNPLDIAPSFANHSSCSIDQSILMMNDANSSFCGQTSDLANQLRQHLLGWSGHVKSWLNAKEIDVHFVRYEDMRLRPLETFRAAIRFAGLEHTDEEILQALDACAFEKLQAQERERGFQEKSARVASFFRKGEVGSWQESLTPKQAKTLLEQHAPMMKQFHYLDQDGGQAFAADIAATSRQPILDTLAGLRRQTRITYQLYGVTLSLPFHFDELTESEIENDRPADVRVTLQSIDCSEVDWEEESICYKAKSGLYLLEVEDVGRYLARDGKEIIIDIAPGADMDAVKLMLLNSVISIVLMQRGAFAFCGSAVVYQGKAYALLGRSSSGKSFFAAGLQKKGFQVLSDSLCVVDNSSPPMIHPGPPFLMLWKFGLLRLKEEIIGLKPVRQSLKKYFYPLDETFHGAPVPLAGIYLLSSHNKEESVIEPLSGARRLFRLLDFTCNEPLVKPMGMLKQQQQIAAAMSKAVPLKRFTYAGANKHQASIDALAQEITEASQQLA
jgi:hypothetical protein